MTDALLCFGELLLRLGSPPPARLLQTPELLVHVGGAEANVAIALASLGHDVRMASLVPDNALGEYAAGELRRRRVDTRLVLNREGRMGLYFLETGAIHRPSEVLYDREQSAFANGVESLAGHPSLLDGVGHLHISGVTPALHAGAARATCALARRACAAGVRVSVDGNYRARLWQAWDSDPAVVTARLFACADIVFADHRDIGIALGRDFSTLDAQTRDAAAADAAFAAFPDLLRVASTIRTQISVDHHELRGQLFTRETQHLSDVQTIAPIVDRIGAGDAFAAGVLHGLRTGHDDRDSLALGVAATCLKHAMPGDYLVAAPRELDAFYGEGRFNVRR